MSRYYVLCTCMNVKVLHIELYLVADDICCIVIISLNLNPENQRYGNIVDIISIRFSLFHLIIYIVYT